MARHSSEFCTTLARIAVRAAKATNWSQAECVDFAWFSVRQDGDASVDEFDYIRHMDAYDSRERD